MHLFECCAYQQFVASSCFLVAGIRKDIRKILSCFVILWGGKFPRKFNLHQVAFDMWSLKELFSLLPAPLALIAIHFFAVKFFDAFGQSGMVFAPTPWWFPMEQRSLYFFSMLCQQFVWLLSRRPLEQETRGEWGWTLQKPPVEKYWSPNHIKFCKHTQ